MTDKEIEVQKQEVVTTEDTERTRECPCFTPRADIYEAEDKIVIVADMPGVGDKSLDIMLEKNILTINGYSELFQPEGYTLAYAEYEDGDYQRSFRISDEIDREKIEATLKNGVLRLHLPKAAAALTKRIEVKAG